MYKICSVPVLNLSFFSVWPARNRHTFTGQLVDSSFVAAHVWSAMTLLGSLETYRICYISWATRLHRKKCTKLTYQTHHQTNSVHKYSQLHRHVPPASWSRRSKCLFTFLNRIEFHFRIPFRTICLYVATAKPLLLLVKPFFYEKHLAYTIYFHF